MLGTSRQHEDKEGLSSMQLQGPRLIVTLSHSAWPHNPNHVLEEGGRTHCVGLVWRWPVSLDDSVEATTRSAAGVPFSRLDLQSLSGFSEWCVGSVIDRPSATHRMCHPCPVTHPVVSAHVSPPGTSVPPAYRDPSRQVHPPPPPPPSRLSGPFLAFHASI